MTNPHSYSVKERMVGNFQCDFCHMASMQGWSGTEYPREEDCPTCCHGERMTPYRIYTPPATNETE